MKILLFSGKARHGKDTCGKIAEGILSENHRVLHIAYADKLKYICKTYFGWNGQKDEEGRTLLQKVGTDVVRLQEPDYWVDEVIHVLKLFPNEWDYVIITDCRFPNEVARMKEEFDAYHIRVQRPNLKSPLTIEQQNHESETALDDYPYDFLVVNDNIDLTVDQIKKIINNI